MGAGDYSLLRLRQVPWSLLDHQTMGDYESPLLTAIAEHGSTMITNRTMNPYCCW